MKKRMIAMLTIVMLLGALTGCGAARTTRAKEPDQKIAKCPVYGRMERTKEAAQSNLTDLVSFTATTLDGETFTQDDFADKDLTALYVWSTTCSACLDEMKDVAAYAEDLPENVRMMTWCLDGAGQQSVAEQIIRRSKMDGVTLIDGDGDLQVLDEQLLYTPTTVFFDSEGKLVGEPLIGAPKKVKESYTEAINEALKAIGKAAIL